MVREHRRVYRGDECLEDSVALVQLTNCCAEAVSWGVNGIGGDSDSGKRRRSRWFSGREAPSTGCFGRASPAPL